MRIFLEKPYLLALLISTVITIWLLSGPSQERMVTISPSPSVTHIPVRIREQQATSLTREIIITGRTAPRRTVILKSELDSRVIAIGAPRGARVKSGELIIRLALEERELRLKEAAALVKQRELEYQATQNLLKKGYQSQTQIAAALTLLESANTQFEQAKLALANTDIRAPFAGILVQRPIEQGDYVMKGSIVAELMEADPFLVVGEVTELQRQYLRLGNTVVAHLVTGPVVSGNISLIAARAEPATRTFNLEVEVPNSEGHLVAGSTCEMHISLTGVLAHKISAALLSLNDEGVLGVKTVGMDNLVQFYPAQFANATSQGIWLTGLPEKLRFITVGQGFVRPGDLVQPVLENQQD